MLDHNRVLLRLEQFLPYRINNLAQRISCSLSHIYQEEFGISIPQWRILVWLNSQNEMTAREIGSYCQMDKVKVSRAVNQLATEGLINRRRNADDQREVILSLTDRGHLLLDELIPRALEWESTLVGSLSAKEYRDLFNIMQKLDKQLDKLNTCELPSEQ